MTSHTKMYLAHRPSIRDTPTQSMRRRPRLGPGSRPVAARVSSERDYGDLTRPRREGVHLIRFEVLITISGS